MKRTATLRERGAVLVETALVWPLVALLTFATVDGGFLLKDYISTGYAADGGAHAGSIAAADSDADWAVLQAVKKNIQPVGASKVTKVIIFRATDGKSTPSAACLAATRGVAVTSGGSAAPGSCNVFTAADLDLSQDDFLNKIATDSSFDSSWAPGSRNASRKAGTDLIGVYVAVNTSTPVSSLGKKTWSLKQSTVIQLETKNA